MYQPLEQFEIEVFFNVINVEKSYFTTCFFFDDPNILFFCFERARIWDLGFSNFIYINTSSIFLYSIFLFFLLIFLFYVLIFFNVYFDFSIVFLFNYFLKLIYNFILDLLKNQINNSRIIQGYFPFLFALFIYICFGNYFGLIPFNFTITSHLLVTFSLSFCVFIGVTIIGLLNNKDKFIFLFVPTNVPIYLLDFLFGIELVSYLSRVLSLSIRLFANMLSGHALMFILSGFVAKIYNSFWCLLELRFIVLIIIFLVSILELGICFLQAYVFIILTIIYLNDSYNLAH